MLIKQLPIVLFCLIKTLEAAVPDDLNALVDTAASEVAVPQISNLSGHLHRMTLKDKIPNEQPGNTEPPKSLLSFFEISEQVEKLIKTLSDRDTKEAVGMIEIGLGQILDSGVRLHEIAPTIGSLPFDAKELVLAVVESKAYTLLKLLQQVYIWHDERQYHWFMALSYGSPWYDEDMWKDLTSFPLDWENNLWAVCDVENIVLAEILREKALQKDILEQFDKELLLLCAEYDAIKIFEYTKIDPAQLKEHFELLVANNSVKLLQLYQTHTDIRHLHLEAFPFPTKLPANVDDFKFLMKNGHKFLPMDRFIKRFCKEGRLDLLTHLRTIDRILAPNKSDLQHAAKNGWIDILNWAFRLGIITWQSFIEFVTLALAFGHFQVFDSWIDRELVGENEITSFYDMIISQAVDAKVLDTLSYIDKQYPIKNGNQEWANLAAKKGILPVLKWLYKKYKILPTTECLTHATPDILDWIQSKDDTLINAELVMCGRSNIDLLQWVFKNAPELIPEMKYASVSEVFNMETMLWLNKNLGIRLFDMNWAYKIGNLEAIEWAKKNCGICPTFEDGHSAAAGGHFHIIYWMHKALDTEYSSCFNLETLLTAIQHGHLGIADYLMLHFPQNYKASVRIDNSVDADRYLSTLKWSFEHKFGLNPSNIATQAVEKGNFEAIKWITQVFPTVKLTSIFWNASTLGGGQTKLYKLLLKEYPSWRGKFEFWGDIENAFGVGNLELVQVILEKDPLLTIKLSESVSVQVTRCNYHIKQWLIENGKW